VQPIGTEALRADVFQVVAQHLIGQHRLAIDGVLVQWVDTEQADEPLVQQQLVAEGM
jgi:hypothetical protein